MSSNWRWGASHSLWLHSVCSLGHFQCYGRFKFGQGGVHYTSPSICRRTQSFSFRSESCSFPEGLPRPSLATAPRAATHSWHIQSQKCSQVTSDSPLLASATLEPHSSSYQFWTRQTRRPYCPAVGAPTAPSAAKVNIPAAQSHIFAHPARGTAAVSTNTAPAASPWRCGTVRFGRYERQRAQRGRRAPHCSGGGGQWRQPRPQCQRCRLPAGRSSTASGGRATVCPREPWWCREEEAPAEDEATAPTPWAERLL